MKKAGRVKQQPQGESEAAVLEFVKAHRPGHIFNVTEAWNWLYDRKVSLGVATIRRYIRRHCEDVRRGQYRIKEA